MLHFFVEVRRDDGSWQRLLPPSHLQPPPPRLLLEAAKVGDEQRAAAARSSIDHHVGRHRFEWGVMWDREFLSALSRIQCISEERGWPTDLGPELRDLVARADERSSVWPRDDVSVPEYATWMLLSDMLAWAETPDARGREVQRYVRAR